VGVFGPAKRKLTVSSELDGEGGKITTKKGVEKSLGGKAED